MVTIIGLSDDTKRCSLKYEQITKKFTIFLKNTLYKQKACRKVFDAYKAKKIRFSHHMHSSGIYITYIVGRSDICLVQLARSNSMGFPRGFPIFWSEENGIISIAGFLSKFDNDKRNDTTISLDGVKSVTFTEKFSGHLCILYAFRHNNVEYVYFGAKNSTGNIYVEVFHDFIMKWYKDDQEKFEGLLNFMMNKHCICFEMCSNDPRLELHGAKYNSSIAISLVIGKTDGTDSIIDFLNEQEAMYNFKKFNLPVSNRYIMEPQSKNKFNKFLNKLVLGRDDMTYQTFKNLLNKFTKKGVIHVIEGSFDHSELSDLLEGLVFWLDKKVIKFKFPNYTRMTMFFRTILVKQIVVPGTPLDCEIKNKLYTEANRWANSWVIYEENKDRHKEIILKTCEDISNLEKGEDITSYNYLDYVDPTLKIVEEQYEENLATNASSWKIEPLKVVLVFGPVGCGKTTLGKHLQERYGESIAIIDVDDFEENTVNGGNTKNNNVYGRSVYEMMMGKIVFILNGGGMFFNTRYNSISIVKELERRARCGVDIVAMMASSELVQYFKQSSKNLSDILKQTKHTVNSRFNRGIYTIKKNGDFNCFPSMAKMKQTFIQVVKKNLIPQEGCIKWAKSNNVPVIEFSLNKNKISELDTEILDPIVENGQPKIDSSPLRFTYGYMVKFTVNNKDYIGHTTCGYGKLIADVNRFLDSSKCENVIGSIIRLKVNSKSNKFVVIMLPDNIVGIQEYPHISVNTEHLPKLNGEVVKQAMINGIDKPFQISLKGNRKNPYNYTAVLVSETINVELFNIYAYVI